MSAIKTVCSVCQFILSVTLLAQVGIIKISWFAWFAHSHGESKTWKGFTVLKLMIEREFDMFIFSILFSILLFCMIGF